MLTKTAARAKARNVLKSLSPAALAAGDAAILQRLLARPEYQNAGTIFCYASVGREADTQRFLAAALAAGKTVAVPLCTGPGQMEARRIFSLMDLCAGAYGIPEPSPAAPLVVPAAFDLAVIPCVACDRTGKRLGHGGGYYDRYLPRLNCPTLCLCREALLWPELPTESTDQSVSLVITETNSYPTP